MEPRVSMVTLGVEDLGRARAFYEKLGWAARGVEETVFFQAGGMALVLWGRGKLAIDSGVDDDGPHSFGGIALAHNVRSKDAVDEVIAAAERAGATVTRQPSETFYGGYAGCFADADGHLWEIAYNPGFPLGDNGSLTVPDFGDPSSRDASVASDP